MSIQDQVNAVAARQGATAIEWELLHSPVATWEEVSSGAGSYAHGSWWTASSGEGAWSNPGVNGVGYVVLESGAEAFHKPFSGVAVATASEYGHAPEEPPVHEAVAWRLAAALGAPYDELVCVCVLREVRGEGGSLSLRAHGEAFTSAPMSAAPDLVAHAAFFDALIGQQDRHLGNMRWDAELQALGLIDHGFAFARPGDMVNASKFTAWRRERLAAALSDAELAVLARLLESDDLLGVAPMLAPARADALRERAQRMAADRSIPG